MVADSRPLVPRALVVGFVVALGGVVFLADSRGLLDASSAWALWPVGVIVLGLVVALQPGADSREVGLIVLVAGIWLFFNAIGLWSYAFWKTWPFILVLLGVWMLARTYQLRQHAGGPAGYDEPTTSAPRLGALAFVAQVHRATTGQVVRSGELTAIAGDVAFDLSDAARGADPIVIDVLALAGRVRLTVPAEWTVELRVLAVPGVAADRRGDADDEATKTVGAVGDAGRPVDLCVRGTAILGVVEVVGPA